MATEAADNLVSMCSVCFFQVSLTSRNTLKYFTQLACFILQSFISGKIFSLVLVKNKKLVLLTFSDNWFGLSQAFIFGNSKFNVVFKQFTFLWDNANDGGTLTLDGGTRPSACPLQFKYCPEPFLVGPVYKLCDN